MGFARLAEGATLRSVAQTANAALRGATWNTGLVHVPAGTREIRIQDARCGMGKLAVLVPLDEVAGALHTHLASMENGAMLFVLHAETPQPCRFGWVIVGAGGHVA